MRRYAPPTEAYGRCKQLGDAELERLSNEYAKTVAQHYIAPEQKNPKYITVVKGRGVNRTSKRIPDPTSDYGILFYQHILLLVPTLNPSSRRLRVGGHVSKRLQALSSDLALTTDPRWLCVLTPNGDERSTSTYTYQDLCALYHLLAEKKHFVECAMVRVWWHMRFPSQADPTRADGHSVQIVQMLLTQFKNAPVLQVLQRKKKAHQHHVGQAKKVAAAAARAVEKGQAI